MPLTPERKRKGRLFLARRCRVIKEDMILSGSSGRLQAIEAVTTYRPSTEHLSITKTSATEFFGVNVFNKAVMKARLPKPVFKSLMKTIDSGSTLDPSLPTRQRRQ